MIVTICSYTIDMACKLLVGFTNHDQAEAHVDLFEWLQIKTNATFLGVSVNTLCNWERAGTYRPTAPHESVPFLPTR